jgi:CheY-like chemotaxis protein
MNGLEFAQAACRDDDLQPRLVFMLAPQKKAMDSSWRDALNAAACLSKPVKPSGLLDALCAVLQGKATAPPSAIPPPVERVPLDRTLRILLAEDSLVNQKLTVAMLRKRGHEVAVANDGVEAVRAAQEQAFDLILMDIQMPEMDGYGATAAIRTRDQALGLHTPIIALTAHAMTGDRERCLQAGMDEYITKPVRAEQLFDTMALVLHPPKPGSSPGDRQQAGPTAIIDWDRALSALDGDPRRLRTFLDGVIEILPGLLTSVQDAIRSRDGAGLQFGSRTLVDTIRYLHADAAMHEAFELERMGRDDRLQEARERFPAFAQTIDRILQACVDQVRKLASDDLA